MKVAILVALFVVFELFLGHIVGRILKVRREELIGRRANLNAD